MSGWPYIGEVPSRFLSWRLFEQSFSARDLLVGPWRYLSLGVCRWCPFSFKLQEALSSVENAWNGCQKRREGPQNEGSGEAPSHLPSGWPPVWQAPCVHTSRKHRLQMEISGERWRNEHQTLRVGYLPILVLQQSHTFVSGQGFDMITVAWTDNFFTSKEHVCLIGRWVIESLTMCSGHLLLHAGHRVGSTKSVLLGTG